MRDDIAPLDDIKSVVLDPGSGVFKAGYAGTEFPSQCFQTVVGLPHLYDETDILKRRNQYLKKLSDKTFVTGETYIVGEEALANRHSHELSYPIERGNVVDWEKMEFVYEHALLDLLEVDPEETLFLITEPPFTSNHTRESTAEFLFEIFQIPGISMMSQAVLSLFSTGRTTGLVVDSGDAVSHVVPVFDGYVIPHCVERLELGGRDVTKYLQRLLLRSGFSFESSAEHHYIREFKEHDKKFVEVNVNPDLNYEDLTAVSLGRDLEKNYEIDYFLPDGQPIKIGRERIQCTEIMFNPEIVGLEATGLSELAFQTIKKCELDIRKEMFGNVVLVGGNTLVKGFQERLAKDLVEKAQSEGNFKPFKVSADPFRQFSSWCGGSVMASLSTFPDLVISIDEWDEQGSSVFYRDNIAA